MATVARMADNKELSLTAKMAVAVGVDRDQYINTVKKSCFPKGECTNEQFMHFLVVADKYDLNPFTKEIYAFPSNGGIQPIVPIDGWLKIINLHPQYDGMEFVDNVNEDGKLMSITCRIHRKDRSIPTEVTEYMSECHRGTEPWKKWPARMLRHKATIQCARYAFSLSGIIDPDESERYEEAKVIDMGTVSPAEEEPVSVFITADQASNLEQLIGDDEFLKDNILGGFSINALTELKTVKFETALDRINTYLEKGQ